jgi:hypothetical protein
VTGRLLAVSPHMSKLLAVATIRESSVDIVCIYPDYDVAKSRQPEYLPELDVIGNVIMKKKYLPPFLSLQVIDAW